MQKSKKVSLPLTVLGLGILDDPYSFIVHLHRNDRIVGLQVRKVPSYSVTASRLVMI
jgi:hypothetical protein